MEQGFPRGGKKDKAKTSDKDKGKKREKGKQSPEERKKQHFLRLDRQLELPSIGYETLVEGTLCLGCVRKVLETKLLVGLPGMTAGTVDIRSISTPYSQVLDKLDKDQRLEEDEVVYPLSTMFREGDIVVAKVMSVVLDGNKHKVSLSLDPKDVHSEWIATDLTEDIVMTGAVKSKEDKGYIVDVGIKGVTAFLPTSNVRLTEKKLGRSLGIGQLISVNITKCEIKRLMARVTLNSNVSKIKQVCPPEGVGVKILPGMRVPCIVVEKRNNGLMVNFLDTIGRVHNDHLADKHRADVSDTVFGRVIFIPPWDVGPYITLDETHCFPYADEPNHGAAMLNSGESRRRRGFVTALEPRGAKVKLHGGGVALLKRQKASDKLDYTDEQFKEDFKLKSEHDFRVLEYSPLDGLFILSTQEHLMDAASVITKDELLPGSTHKVIVVSYNQGGAIVKLGEVKGFIPYLHFKDKVLSPQFVQKKYPPGSKLAVKVFQLDVGKNSVIFTAKKTLRLSQGLVASTFGNLEIGSTGHGIVRFIPPNDKGFRIQMIGGILGFVPKGKIPSTGTDAKIPLSDRFPIGLPIEFKVIEVDVQRERAILTLDLDYEVKIPNSKKQTKKRQAEDDSHASRNKKKRKQKIESEEDPPPVSETRRSRTSTKQNKDTHKEIPTLGKIPALKRKIEVEEDKVASKKKMSKAKKSEEIEADESSKRTKFRKTKLVEKKKESEDSGIEDEDTPALKLATKSFWDIVPPDHNHSDSNSDSHVKVRDTNREGKGVGKKTGDKQGIADKESFEHDAHMTEKDHELHLIQNPSDPKAWRAFKEFALRSGDPAKAVSIIKRMKDKIPFRDEKGKLLCWLTVLQIEIQYGTPNSVKSTLDEALKVNDPTAVLDRTAQFYESVDKKDEAEEMYRRRLKMQQHQPESWLNLGMFLYKNGKVEAARSLLSSALKQLSESHQIYVTAKFAKMEIELGDLEKGRSMLLTICLQRPKRIDLWLLYANSLYKMKQFQLASDALHTALGTKQLSPKECKPLLKRLVEIEKAHGTEASLLKLKAEAAQYLSLNDIAI